MSSTADDELKDSEVEVEGICCYNAAELGENTESVHHFTL